MNTTMVDNQSNPDVVAALDAGRELAADLGRAAVAFQTVAAYRPVEERRLAETPEWTRMMGLAARAGGYAPRADRIGDSGRIA